MSSLEYLGTTGEIDQVCLQAGVERVLILFARGQPERAR
jgi:hypothetical protein